jgi:hypothetical protein
MKTIALMIITAVAATANTLPPTWETPATTYITSIDA